MNTKENFCGVSGKSQNWEWLIVGMLMGMAVDGVLGDNMMGNGMLIGLAIGASLDLMKVRRLKNLYLTWGWLAIGGMLIGRAVDRWDIITGNHTVWISMLIGLIIGGTIDVFNLHRRRQ